MSSIRIIEVPPSSIAPRRICEQWVGIELPLATEEELRQNPLSGLRRGSKNMLGYIIVRSKAIEALKAARKDEAAKYWDSPAFGTYLQFTKSVCRLIE